MEDTGNGLIKTPTEVISHANEGVTIYTIGIGDLGITAV
jgi:hypothetical protein